MKLSHTELMKLVASNLSCPEDITDVSFLTIGSHNYVFTAMRKCGFEKKKVVFKLPKNSFFPFLLKEEHLNLFGETMISFKSAYLRHVKAITRLGGEAEAERKILHELEKIFTILQYSVRYLARDSNYYYLIVLPYSFSYFKMQDIKDLSFLKEHQILKDNYVPFDETRDFPSRACRVFNNCNNDAIEAGIVERAQEAVITICKNNFNIWISPFIESNVLCIDHTEKFASFLRNDQWFIDPYNGSLRVKDEHLVLIDPGSAFTQPPKSPISKAYTTPIALEDFMEYWKKDKENTDISSFLHKQYKKHFSQREEESKHFQLAVELCRGIKSSFPYKLGVDGTEVFASNLQNSALFFSLKNAVYKIDQAKEDKKYFLRKA
jgi:hypothetical protein